MGTERSAEATVEVGVDPATALRIFTEEIALWWVPGPINFFDAARATGMAVEPGIGVTVPALLPAGWLSARVTAPQLRGCGLRSQS